MLLHHPLDRKKKHYAKNPNTNRKYDMVLKITLQTAFTDIIYVFFYIDGSANFKEKEERRAFTIVS